MLPNVCLIFVFDYHCNHYHRKQSHCKFDDFEYRHFDVEHRAMLNNVFPLPLIMVNESFPNDMLTHRMSTFRQELTIYKHHPYSKEKFIIAKQTIAHVLLFFSRLLLMVFGDLCLSEMNRSCCMLVVHLILTNEFHRCSSLSSVV